MVVINSSNPDEDGKYWLDPGAFWAAVTYPVVDGNRLTFFSQKEGFFWPGSRQNIVDKAGNRWFASRLGLQVLSGDSIYFIGKDQGLDLPTEARPSKLVEDNKGNIWLYSGAVISCVIPKRGSPGFEVENIINLTKWNGLKGNLNGNCALIIDSQNKLWIGNEKGTGYLDLNNIDLTTARVIPQLLSLNINSEFNDYRNMPDSLKYSFGIFS